MLGTSKNTPQAVSGDQATVAKSPYPRKPFAGRRCGDRKPEQSNAPPTTCTSMDSPGTSSSVAEAPSAPTPAADARPPKAETRGGRRNAGWRTAKGRDQEPKAEQTQVNTKAAPSNSNDMHEKKGENVPPQSTPGDDGNVDPAKPRGNRFPGRGRHTCGRGGGRPYGRFRSEKQPADSVTGGPSNDPTPQNGTTEHDSSSSCLSSVQTPMSPHSNLPPDETSIATSQSATSPPWPATEPGTALGVKSAISAEPSLDSWADQPASADVWMLESAEPPPCTPDSRQPPPPSESSNSPRPPQPVQPPSDDDSPTSVRRVGTAFVILGPGAGVQHVFTDAESPWVMLSNLPRSTQRFHIENLIAPFGVARYIRVYKPNNTTKYLCTARILFERHEQARAAVDALQGQICKGKQITARLDTEVSGGSIDGTYVPNGSSAVDSQSQAQSSLIASDPAMVIKSCTVKVTWYALTSTVYVTYAASKFALARVKELNGRMFGNRRMHITAMFSERDYNLEKMAKENGGYMVRIAGLMGDPELKTLSRLVRLNDIVVHPNYSSEIGLVKLREELGDVAPLESFKLLPNRCDDVKLHALAQYTTPTAAAAVKVFENRRGEYLGNSPILVSRHLVVRYSVSARLTEVLQGEINKIHSWAIDDPDLNVRQQEDGRKPGFVQLTLAGNNTKQLVVAKAHLDRALAGVPLSTLEGTKIWDRYFTTEEGASFLQSVAELTNICVRADRRTNSILLFGPRYAQDDASQQLRDKLESLSRLRQIMTIPKPVFRRLSMGGLTILRNLVGKGNIHVNFLDETLTFSGDEEVVRRVKNTIDVMYSEVGSRLQRRSDCVYVASAAENRMLPLVCVGNDCKTPIPLSMITLHAPQVDQDALFYATFQAHVALHPDQYQYCPTPDCQYIYCVGPEDAQHEGILCVDYKSIQKETGPIADQLASCFNIHLNITNPTSHTVPSTQVMPVQDQTRARLLAQKALLERQLASLESGQSQNPDVPSTEQQSNSEVLDRVEITFGNFLKPDKGSAGCDFNLQQLLGLDKKQHGFIQDTVERIAGAKLDTRKSYRNQEPQHRITLVVREVITKIPEFKNLSDSEWVVRQYLRLCLKYSSERARSKRKALENPSSIAPSGSHKRPVKPATPEPAIEGNNVEHEDIDHEPKSDSETRESHMVSTFAPMPASEPTQRGTLDPVTAQPRVPAVQHATNPLSSPPALPVAFKSAPVAAANSKLVNNLRPKFLKKKLPKKRPMRQLKTKPKVTMPAHMVNGESSDGNLDSMPGNDTPCDHDIEATVAKDELLELPQPAAPATGVPNQERRRIYPKMKPVPVAEPVSATVASTTIVTTKCKQPDDAPLVPPNNTSDLDLEAADDNLPGQAKRARLTTQESTTNLNPVTPARPKLVKNFDTPDPASPQAVSSPRRSARINNNPKEVNYQPPTGRAATQRANTAPARKKAKK
ncbi:Cell surface glycoprotein 1 [Ceratobasidium theobromae]|uniref:Cell surface glycoprotein 1 n=1 Tax=Ceratobasidium theobromae TaxID=1582974 RepID=A0A5N5QJ45_9AGAM|nr:Cell surface glycoprotein 1 [Ceratobasidium theobromae]